MVGNETWDQQSRVRIQLGPLTLEQYMDFLPGHEGHRQLRSLTQFYAGGEYDVEVQLILRRQEVPACELKPQDGEGRQLGWTSWMKIGGVYARRRRDGIGVIGFREETIWRIR